MVESRFVGGSLVLDLLSEASWNDLRLASLPDESFSLSDLSARLILLVDSFSGRDDSLLDRTVSFSERVLALTFAVVIEASTDSFSERLDSLSGRAAGDRRR